MNGACRYISSTAPAVFIIFISSSPWLVEARCLSVPYHVTTRTWLHSRGTATFIMNAERQESVKRVCGAHDSLPGMAMDVHRSRTGAVGAGVGQKAQSGNLALTEGQGVLSKLSFKPSSPSGGALKTLSHLGFLTAHVCFRKEWWKDCRTLT